MKALTTLADAGKEVSARPRHHLTKIAMSLL
jgi:hypothetical protein